MADQPNDTPTRANPAQTLATRPQPPSFTPRGGGRATITGKSGFGGKPTPSPTEELAQYGQKGCWTWQNDASLPLADTSHRRQVWWAIDTVNANAWPVGANYMSLTVVDFLLAQEVRVAKGYPKLAAEQAARGDKWSLAIEPCAVAKAGGRSVGTAVATRSYIGMSDSQPVITSQHLHAQGRFAMKRVSAMGKGGVHLGSTYLVSNQVGVQAKFNLDISETVGFTLKSLTGPWIVGGDWNCTPADLEATGWLKKVGGVIKAPITATCFGKVYDFSSWQPPLRTTSSVPTALEMLASSRTRPPASSSKVCPEPS